LNKTHTPTQVHLKSHIIEYVLLLNKFGCTCWQWMILIPWNWALYVKILYIVTCSISKQQLAEGCILAVMVQSRWQPCCWSWYRIISSPYFLVPAECCTNMQSMHLFFSCFHFLFFSFLVFISHGASAPLVVVAIVVPVIVLVCIVRDV
jgi:hypothetical protein